jgi:hypothetical protein
MIPFGFIILAVLLALVVGLTLHFVDESLNQFFGMDGRREGRQKKRAFLSWVWGGIACIDKALVLQDLKSLPFALPAEVGNWLLRVQFSLGLAAVFCFLVAGYRIARQLGYFPNSY